MTRDTGILVVGGGLGGLYAAHLLAQRGITDCTVLEARAAPGGRIQSAAGLPSADGASAPWRGDRFDLGPTWFWPALQPGLAALLQALGLASFPQQEDGDLLLDRSRTAPPARTAGYVSQPAGHRVHGGMVAMVEALAARLPAGQLVCGQRVTQLRHLGDCVAVDTVDSAGTAATWTARGVLLALPPRLAAGIAFSPALPPALQRQWAATPTWMAPHAKYLAVYDEPFWRDQGLSGEARSSVGPMGEIHDASFPGGQAALFGFLGVPAATRLQVGEEMLRAHCRLQLERLFGPRAAHPVAEWLKDWSLDPWTCTPADLQGDAHHHAPPPPATAAAGPWAGMLAGVASEWSTAFPGYLAGALDAAAQGVTALLGSPAATTP